MSLDLSLSPPKCETCGHEPEGFDFNITYNLSKMWYALYPDNDRMLPIENLNGHESLEIINGALFGFTHEEETLIKLNPPNGWGSYDVLLKTLRDMRNACEDHPDWIWSADG